MYRHASIRAIIEKVFFKTMLSDGIQFAEDFDDSFPENADESDDHTPTFPDVTFAVVLTAVCRNPNTNFIAHLFLVSDQIHYPGVVERSLALALISPHHISERI
jgi:hypothetical protein